MSSIVKVRLWGGPMHLTYLELPIETKKHKIGRFWTYEDTGDHAPDGARLFAKLPRRRRQRQFLLVARKMSMRDQRLYVPQKPFVLMVRECKHGKAARARRERRNGTLD